MELRISPLLRPCNCHLLPPIFHSLSKPFEKCRWYVFRNLLYRFEYSVCHPNVPQIRALCLLFRKWTSSPLASSGNGSCPELWIDEYRRWHIRGNELMFIRPLMDTFGWRNYGKGRPWLTWALQNRCHSLHRRQVRPSSVNSYRNIKEPMLAAMSSRIHGNLQTEQVRQSYIRYSI